MRNSKIRTLQRAVEAFGGVPKLAAYLNVERAQLEDWVTGRVEIPPEVFGAALDVVAAGPFARWSGDEDEKVASRNQARANHLQGIADRIRASAKRAQLTADQAQRSADRSTAVVRVQRLMANATDEQKSARPTEPSDKLAGQNSTIK